MAKRGKTPSLISGSNGKPSTTEAKKRRNCKRCNCNINLGEKLFEIPKTGGGFSNKKPYCISCFKKILDQTKKDLGVLESIWNKLHEG